MRVMVAAAVCMLSAGGAQAASCRLTTAECAIVAEEQRAAEIAKIQDERNFPHSLPSAQRRLALLDREQERFRSRLKYLPKNISAELVRLLGCDVAAYAAAGRPYTPSPACRD